MNKIIKLCISMAIISLFHTNGALASAGAAVDDDKRPPEHTCRITLETMKNPVVADDGQTYEKSAIEAHFAANGLISPLTRQALTDNRLIPNQALKRMIKEWQPGSRAGPSQLDGRPATEIAQRIRDEFARNSALLTPEHGSKGRHIVAFLGNTGAGKSTTVNLLAGKRIRESDDGTDYVLEDPSDGAAMVIGREGESKTVYPKSIDVDIHGQILRLFDLPGFNDTDGSERNLVNAAFIRQILLDAESVRFVFVVGEDQFTADRSASVKHMFRSLQQLFVVEGEEDPIANGLFLATKVTCKPGADIINFLLRRTNAGDKEDLNQQLQSWQDKDKIVRILHPIRGGLSDTLRDEIIESIHNTRPTRVRGLNVSALYPSDTQRDLERMFLTVLDTIFSRDLPDNITSLSGYDQAIALYSDPNFWALFDEGLPQKDEALCLLREFCAMPYRSALSRFERENESTRQAHVVRIQEQRQAYVADIKKRTAERAQAVIAEMVPQSEDTDYVNFDFAYHPAVYDRVCGVAAIAALATEPAEQEIVRQSYAEFISQHSHGQVMRWHERYSGMAEMMARVEAVEKNLGIK